MASISKMPDGLRALIFGSGQFESSGSRNFFARSCSRVYYRRKKIMTTHRPTASKQQTHMDCLGRRGYSSQPRRDWTSQHERILSIRRSASIRV
jgi:hypothetical protein